MNREERGLEVPYSVLENVLTEEDVELLRGLVLSMFGHEESNETQEVSSVVEIDYKPKLWGPAGDPLHKAIAIFRKHVQENFFLLGNLKPKKILAVKTEEAQEYLNNDYSDNFEDEDGNVLYTAIIPVSKMWVDYTYGKLLYTVLGSCPDSDIGRIIIHRNEFINRWQINQPRQGTRYDLVLIQEEVDENLSYEFEIEQTNISSFTDF